MRWVREFYANLKYGPPFEFYSTVRSRLIKFDDTTIREFFGLEYLEPDTIPISKDDLNELMCPNSGKCKGREGAPLL